MKIIEYGYNDDFQEIMKMCTLLDVWWLVYIRTLVYFSNVVDYETDDKSASVVSWKTLYDKENAKNIDLGFTMDNFGNEIK